MATIREDYSTNLVSYWKLEEASGFRYDAHGSNDLTDNNTVGQGTGKQGNCADFEYGSTEYLSITDANQSGLDITGDLTICAWLKVESNPANGFNPIVSKLTSASRSYLFDITNGNTIRFYYSTNGSTSNYSVSKSWTPTAGVWYHVALVFDASAGQGEFFVDGSSLGTSTAGGTSLHNGTADFEIGGNTGFSRSFDGLIDEVGIWNAKLSSADIAAIYNSGDGIPYLDASDVKNNTTLSTNIISYWELETDGTDSVTATGNDLTDNGTPSYTTGGGGVQGEAVDLEASSSQYLSIADGSQTGLDLNSDLSFSFWFKAESLGSANCVISKGWPANGNTDSSYFINLNSTNIEFQMGNGTSLSSLDQSASFSTATWYHVVVTYDISAGAATYYVDGVPIGTVTGGQTAINNSSQDFQVGRLRSGLWHFDGIIDELGVWDRALTKGEVDELYNAGSGIPYEAAAAGGTNMQINISDSWKTVDAVKINVGDTWRDVVSIKQNVGDSWKTVF